MESAGTLWFKESVWELLLPVLVPLVVLPSPVLVPVPGPGEPGKLSSDPWLVRSVESRLVDFSMVLLPHPTASIKTIANKTGFIFWSFRA